MSVDTEQVFDLDVGVAPYELILDIPLIVQFELDVRMAPENLILDVPIVEVLP